MDLREELTLLLASVAGGRCHWGEVPQGTETPYVQMQRAGGVVDYHMQGPSGYSQTRVQFDIYTENKPGKSKVAAGAETLASIKSILDGYRGGRIQGVFFERPRDLSAVDTGEVTHLNRVSIDALFHHSEL